MTRFTSYRWAGAVVTAIGLFATAIAGQPPRPGTPPDPIDAAKARQKIADEKVTSDVNEAIRLADGLAKSSPARAVEILKKAQADVVDLAVGISGDTRKNLTSTLQARIAVYGGKAPALPTPGTKLDPKGPEVRAAQADVAAKYFAELKDVREGIKRIETAQLAGRNNEANAEVARLTKLYPTNPSVWALGQRDTMQNRLADAQAYYVESSRRWVANQKNINQSSLPAIMDVEFPKDWPEKSKMRLAANAVQLTAKEQKIIEALDKPSLLNFTERPLDEALQDLSNMFDLPLLIDKKSLEDLSVDLKKGVSIQGKGLSGRTVLRSILATQGLTYVVKDETIQIVTVEKAQTLLTTRVYYLGDIVQAGVFSGPEFGPVINGIQTAENAKMITDLITKSIDPLMWKENGGLGTVTFHFPSKSLIVRASSEVHFKLGKSFGGGK